MKKPEMIRILLEDFKNGEGVSRYAQVTLHAMLSGLDDESLSVLVAQATKQKLEKLAKEKTR